MASAAPQKRMVSSVFITLSAPHRATVTQQRQQPALHTQSGPAADRQHAAARVSPAGDNLRRKVEDRTPSSAHGAGNSKKWTQAGPRATASDPQSQPQPTKAGPAKVDVQEKNRSSTELLPPPPPPPDMLPSSFSEDSTLPPPPPCLPSTLHPQSADLPSFSNKEPEAFSSPRGSTHDKETNGIHRNGQDVTAESKDLCGFCRLSGRRSLSAVFSGSAAGCATGRTGKRQRQTEVLPRVKDEERKLDDSVMG